VYFGTESSVTASIDWGTDTSYGNNVSNGSTTPGYLGTTFYSLAVDGLSASTTYHYRAKILTAANCYIYGSDVSFTTPGSGGGQTTTLTTTLTTTSTTTSTTTLTTTSTTTSTSTTTNVVTSTVTPEPVTSTVTTTQDLIVTTDAMGNVITTTSTDNLVPNGGAQDMLLILCIFSGILLLVNFFRSNLLIAIAGMCVNVAIMLVPGCPEWLQWAAGLIAFGEMIAGAVKALGSKGQGKKLIG
jgi:hypothetical protein